MTAPTLTRELPLEASGNLRPTRELHRRSMVALDLLLLVAAVLGTVVVQSVLAGSAPLERLLTPLPWVIIATWILILSVRRLWADPFLGHRSEKFRQVVEAGVLGTLIFSAGHYLAEASSQMSTVIAPFLAATAALLAGRLLMRRQRRTLTAEGLLARRVLVVASPAQAQELGGALASTSGAHSGYLQTGVFLLEQDRPTHPREIIGRARDVGADTILYAPTGREGSQWTRQLTWELEGSGVELLISPAVRQVGGQRLSVDQVKGMAVVRVAQPEFSLATRVGKRTLDIVGASIGLLVLSLPLLIIGLVIRRDSDGPALFRQVRLGMDSEEFECLKFRTMRVGADAERAALRAEIAMDDDHTATFKMVDDPRITRVGHFLRKYSIDELPQLVNVLRGDMSLVGPRPHTLDDVGRYDEVAFRRLRAKPGMTGLWQVSGRSDLEWSQALDLDLYYAENWSMEFDLMILAKTVKVVATGSGAY